MIHKYGKLSDDKLEEHFSNFLRDSWSYSGLSEFINNPKAFEMKYIYNIHSQSSAAGVSGNAYHAALQYYFGAKKEGILIDIIKLEQIAFDYIESIEPDKWKIQKTTPTIEDCLKKSFKTVSSLINNFYAEKAIYEDYIDEVLEVEVFCDEWITVNGVDIPLPCRAKLDLVVKTKSGKISIIDHKSKTSFTDEKAAQYVIGQQAMTYVLGYESKADVKVDEVCFIENKHSKNKGGSNQLKPILVELSDNTRKIYEYFLYEGLRNMLIALQDPDYVYPINYRDNLNDFNVLFEFAADTILSEVDTINVTDSKKDLLAKRQKKIKDSSLSTVKIDAVKMIKKHASEFIQYDLSNKNMTQAEKIEHTFKTLGVSTKVEHTIDGYSSDTFLLEVTAGTQLATLYKYRLDIARSLSTPSVRMMKDLFVYEGKSFFAIEATKEKCRSLAFDSKEVNGSKIPIGKSNFDETIVWDLENHSTPHILVCGSTGSGKTVFLTSTLEYVLQAKQANRVVIYDRKNEFAELSGNPLVSIYTDLDDIEASAELEVENMSYLIKKGTTEKVLIIFDEFTQSFMEAKKGNDLKVYEDQCIGNYSSGAPKMKRVHVDTKKSLEENIKMIAQLGRSSGYRMIVATQRASAKIISGDTKVNFPVQICFKVPKEIDSKVVIDESGAETLRGYGDGLVRSPQYLNTIRFQGFYKK